MVLVVSRSVLLEVFIWVKSNHSSDQILQLLDPENDG